MDASLIMILGSLLVLVSVGGLNLYLSTNETSCTQFNLYRNVSCLPYCPAGYSLDSGICIEGSDPLIFFTEFFSFTEFSASSFKNFTGRPEIEFNSSSRKTPVPTYSKGFYFESTSAIELNSTYLIAPDFCFSIYFRSFNYGTIFQVKNDSMTFLELRSSASFLEFYVNLTFNSTSSIINKISIPYSNDGYWYSLSISATQLNGSVNFIIFRNEVNATDSIRYDKKEYQFGFNSEFRVPYNEISYIFGSYETTSFNGFIYYSILMNDNSCPKLYYKTITDCGLNKYDADSNCYNCFEVNTWPPCFKNSSNYCYSQACTDCTGYSIKECIKEISSQCDQPNCSNWDNYICTSCDKGFILNYSLCLPDSVLNESILITFNDFKGLYGDFFMSGANPETFYFNNTPEIDDPLPLYQKGLYFNGYSFLESNKTILNVNFSMVMWVYHTQTILNHIFQKSNLVINSDFSVSVYLRNCSESVNKNTQGFSVDGWIFIGVSIEYALRATTLIIYQKNYILWMETFNKRIFYDTNSSIKIQPYRAFIYLLNLYPYSDITFMTPKKSCSSQSSNDCLIQSNEFNSYFDTYSKLVKNCPKDCATGCRTYYSCNICKNLSCEFCNGFDSDCNSSTTYDPCLYGSEFNKTKLDCEVIGCNDTINSTGFLCPVCMPGYYYLDFKCYKECPTMFIVSGSNCTKNFTFYTMSKIVFDKPYFTSDTSDIIYYISNYSSLNSSESSKPLPAKSRGYYFKNNSFIYTNSIILPHQVIFGFYMYEMKAGTIIEKYNKFLSTNGLFNLSEQSIKIENYIFDQVWLYFHFKFVSLLPDLSTFTISINNYYFYSVSSGSYFYDNSSSLKIGCLNNGFEGFIYMFYISYLQENFTLYSGLWPCQFEYYWAGSSCQICESKCLNGCATNPGCSLCNDSICSICKDYQDSCSKCLPNAQLVENKCKCSEGFFWNSSYDFCDTCKYNNSLYEGCLKCQEGYFKSGLTCLICHPSCQACTSNSSNSCIKCKPGAHLENTSCICNTTFYKSGDDCLPCPDPCLNCSSGMYFSCSNCKTSLLEGMCYNKCPLGYKKQRTLCIPDSLQSVKFRFDGLAPSLRELNTKKSAEPCSKHSEVLVYPRRGVYFNGLNTCIRFKPGQAIVGPSFFVYAWVRPLNQFELFQLFTSKEFSFKVSPGPSVIFSAFLSGDNVNAIIDESLSNSEWNYLVVGLNYSIESEFFYLINKVRKIQSFSQFPYKDSENSTLILGSTVEFGNYSMGFLFAFDILNIFLEPEYYSGRVCEIFPSFFYGCLDKCHFDQFMDEDGECFNCSSDCKFGCFNSTTCQICKDQNCFQCDTLDLSVCRKCNWGFEVIKGNCYECELPKYYDVKTEKCKNCHPFCTYCNSSEICTACQTNFTLNSANFCECIKGFKLKGLFCEQIMFEAGLQILMNNSILIRFEFDLSLPISSKDISVKIDAITSDFELEKLDSKTYFLNLIPSKSIKMHEKHRIFLKFLKKITSVEKYLLENKVLQGALYQLENLEELAIAQAQVKEVAKSGKSATVSSGSAAAGSAFLGMNPAGLFNLINMIEIYIYSLIFDVEFDETYEEFIDGLKSTMKIPNIIQSNLKIVSKIPGKYQKLGITSSYFLVNSSSALIILFFILFLQLICHSFQVSGNSRLERIGMALRKRMVFGYYLRFLIQFIFDLSVFCLISILNTELTGIFNIFDFTVSIAILFFLILSLFLIIYKLFQVYNCGSSPEKIETILEEFKKENLSCVLYYVLFIIRRMFLSVSIVLFSEPFLQVTVSLVLTIVVRNKQILFYLIITVPFKSKLTLVFNILNEIHILSYFIFLSFTLGKESTKSLENTKLLIYIITSTIIMSGVFSVVEAVINIRRLIFEKCSKKDTVIPIRHITTASPSTNVNFASLPNIKRLAR